MADSRDDMVFDDSAEDLDDSVVAEEHQADAIKKLREKLKEAEAKAKACLDDLQRAKADFVNMRRRDEEERKEFVKFAKSDVLSELIPILDSCNQAVEHGHKDVDPIYKQILNILKRHGLEEINPEGETFDPQYHEAVAAEETSKRGEDHRIIEVLQKGYILSGKIIRPAKVKIKNYNG